MRGSDWRPCSPSPPPHLARAHDLVTSHLAFGNYWYKSLCTGWKYIIIDAWRWVFLPSQMDPPWLGWLLAQHKPRPWDTLTVKDAHCCDWFHFFVVVLKSAGFCWYSVFFLNPRKGAAFSGWAAKIPHLQPEKRVWKICWGLWNQMCLENPGLDFQVLKNHH